MIQRRPAEEDRRSVAVTVAWMLATMATTAAFCGGCLAWFLVGLWQAPDVDLGMFPALPGLLLLVGFLTGITSLVMIPAVYRFRETPPPVPVTLFSVVVSLLPAAALAVRAWG